MAQVSSVWACLTPATSGTGFSGASHSSPAPHSPASMLGAVREHHRVWTTPKSKAIIERQNWEFYRMIDVSVILSFVLSLSCCMCEAPWTSLSLGFSLTSHHISSRFWAQPLEQSFHDVWNSLKDHVAWTPSRGKGEVYSLTCNIGLKSLNFYWESMPWVFNVFSFNMAWIFHFQTSDSFYPNMVACPCVTCSPHPGTLKLDFRTSCAWPLLHENFLHSPGVK